jgi:hypothetical protein
MAIVVSLMQALISPLKAALVDAWSIRYPPQERAEAGE